MDRLFEPRRDGRLMPRPRFAAFILLCLLLHAAILAFLLWEDQRNALLPPAIEEIPVEVITEPPPQPKEEPPPPEPPQPEQKAEEQKQKPPPPPTEIEEPAFDAPKLESKEKSEQNAPEEAKEAKTKRNEPEKLAPKDEKPQGLKDAQDDADGDKPPEPAPEKQVEDKPDAEIIERAEKTPTPTEKPDTKDTKPAKKGDAKSIADQVAALAPLPDFKLAAPPKQSPVGGGQAKTTYLTILYGLIMPHMQIPARVRASQISSRGVVAFYIDEMGNLTHQAVYKSSGMPDLDAAALSAVRRAAPFPPPPRGLPHSMLFTYATK
ncbi:TonB family protein [Methylocystis sp. WRRC1]|nr:TonB family protein [Methylocystis sp. WRRC1]